MSARRNLRLGVLLTGVSVLGATACGADEPVAPTQTLQGAIGTGWQTTPTEVRAVGRTATFSSAVDAAGRFSLDLVGHETYAFEFLASDGSVIPMVMARAGGVASLKLRVQGGAPAFDMGPVHRVAPFISGDMPVRLMSTLGAPALGTVDGDDIECEDGVDAKTGLPCVDDDDESQVCENEEDDDEEEEEDDDDDDDEHDDDDENEYQAVPLALDEAAVPTRVPPSHLGSCDDEHEVEGEEEHED